ncbi:hypothetical protein CCP3SC15_1610012 [Gammaproteobacteria bacterium]
MIPWIYTGPPDPYFEFWQQVATSGEVMLAILIGVLIMVLGVLAIIAYQLYRLNRKR